MTEAGEELLIQDRNRLTTDVGNGEQAREKRVTHPVEKLISTVYLS